MMIVILSSTIVCYSLYSTSNPEKPHMIFTTIFVVYGVLRYNYIINTTNENNPTDIVLKDNALKINVILWIITCLIILIFSDIFSDRMGNTYEKVYYYLM